MRVVRTEDELKKIAVSKINSIPVVSGDSHTAFIKVTEDSGYFVLMARRFAGPDAVLPFACEQYKFTGHHESGLNDSSKSINLNVLKEELAKTKKFTLGSSIPLTLVTLKQCLIETNNLPKGLLMLDDIRTQNFLKFYINPARFKFFK